jgi:uncharacterized membrane protein YhhN
MPILGFYIFLNARRKQFANSKMLIFLAITCAWIGDILLLKSGDAFFVMALFSFLGTHIFYSIFFYRVHPVADTSSYETVFISMLILGSAYYLMYGFITEDLNDFPKLKIPIYAYAIAIGIMAILAGNIVSNRSKRNLAIQYFIPGAVLFIASDATLAIHKFKYMDVEFLEVIVMMTYGYAQCVMAQGFTKYLKG